MTIETTLRRDTDIEPKRETTEPPRVSVVIPSYDRPGLLVEAVESVRAQTYDDIELIVVDDHSPDPVVPHLREMDLSPLTEVRCLRHEENRGANAARNTGIRAARGEFISFLDDDDRWDPELIARQVKAFDRADDVVGVVYAGTNLVGPNGEVIGTSRPSATGDVTEALIGGAIIGSFSRVMVRSTVIDDAGTPDERFPGWQDKEWYFRLSQYCEFKAVDDLLVYHRMGDQSQITDDFTGKRDISYPLFLEKHRSTAATYGWLAERQLVASLSRTLGFSALANGYYTDAVRYTLVSLAYYPFAPKAWVQLGLVATGPKTFRSVRRAKQYVSRVVN
jgi:glycosyltransferase involved in cell wall biosynthesis